jgi:protein-disulfide isomerase
MSGRLTLPVDPARDHIQGDAAAPVTLVEYGDYECPYCGMAYPIVKSIQEKMGDRLRFVFRNFPLTELHPHAEHAAELAEAAAAEGGESVFWLMHDALFEHQKALGYHHLRDLAAGVGLDGERILKEVREGAYEERVQEDFMSGVRSGVNGTPTFFIGGARHDGSWDEQTLLAALEKASSGVGQG